MLCTNRARTTLKPLSFAVAYLVTEHPRKIAIAALLMATVSVFPLRNLTIDPSAEKYASEKDQERLDLEEHRGFFGITEPVVVGLISDESVFRVGTLTDIEKLQGLLEAAPGVESVWSLASTPYVRATSDGVEVGRLFDQVPTDAALAESVRAEVMSSALGEGLLVAPDERTAFFLLRSTQSGQDTRLVHGVDEAIAKYSGAFRIAASGRPYLAVAISDTSLRDVLMFVPITLLGLTLLLSYLYRSVWTAILPLGAVGVATLVVVALETLRGKALSEMDTMLPTLFAAVGVAYSMHLLDRYVGTTGNVKERVAAAMRPVVLPVAISAVTTMVGFSALSTSSLPAVREFSVFGSMGIGLVGVAVIFLVPALIMLVQPKMASVPKTALTERFIRACSWATHHHPGMIVLAFIVLTVATIIGGLNVKVDNSFLSWIPQNHKVRTDFEMLQETGVGANPIYLDLDTGSVDGVLEPGFLERVAGLQRRLESSELVVSSLSLATFVKELHRAAAGEHDGAFPDSTELLSQYLLLYESSDFASMVEQLVDFDRQRISIPLGTKVKRSSDLTQLKDEIEDLVASELPGVSARVTGVLPVLFSSTDRLAKEQARSLGLAIIAVTLAMALALGSLRWALLAIPSNALPITIIFGLMGWTGIPLDMISSVVACLTLGIVVDDSVHFIICFRDELARTGSRTRAVAHAYDVAGRPIVFTSVVISGAFAVFLFSSFQGIYYVGSLATCAIIAALLADMLLLPVLLRFFAPRGPRRNSRT